MFPLSDWQPLLTVQAGAAATLTGLVFVAVSLNLTKILEVPGLPGRAAESLAQFLQVFFVSTLVLVPRQPATALAWEILLIAACSWGLQMTAQVRYARWRKGHPVFWLLNRTLASQLATLPFFVAGTLLLAGAPNAIYWLVPGFLFSFAAGVMSAWVLLIEILR